jgi:hypothetical protein
MPDNAFLSDGDRNFLERSRQRMILDKCEELAREYFDSTGDVMAVAYSLRNVILARFEWVAKHGKDAGE